ncbi:MAG: acyl-CoA dehydrogenase family protein [Pseudomonadota bacterium]
MDLNYGAEYETFRNEVRAFLVAHRHLAPGEFGNNPEFVAWQRLLVENGYAARNVPKRYGGYGADVDLLHSRIIAEEFAQAKIPPGVRGQGVTMLVPTLLEFGSEAQRERWIRPTLNGDIFWCQGYSEPEAGSDLASLKTHAYVDGDEFVINGQKIWTSSAHFADMMFCLVRTEPDAAKHDGISYVLISMDTPGIEIRPLVQMTGEPGFNEVFFTDVRVPVENVVGGRGQGWRVANGTLKYERSMLGDPDVSAARLSALVELMRRETLNGRPIIENPVFRDRLLRIQGRVLALRANDLRILSNELNADDNTELARMVVKLQGTELRHELEALGIDALGELGVLYDDSPELRDAGRWQTDYMYYLGLIIGGGTSQVQKNIIGERGLGLPKEPKQAAAN